MIFRELDKTYFEGIIQSFCKDNRMKIATAVKIFGPHLYLPRNEDKKMELIEQYKDARLLGLTYSETRELYWQGYTRAEILAGHWEIDSEGNQIFKPLVGTNSK